MPTATSRRPWGASAPTMRIVTPVRMNPSAVWIASAEPDVPGGASSEIAVENWAESATTVAPQKTPRQQREPRRRAEQEPDREGAPAAAGHRDHRDRRPADSVGDEPGYDAAEPADSDDRERAEAGQ